MLDTLLGAGVEVVELPSRGRFQLFKRARQVAALARREKCAILVGYELEANLVALLARLLLVGKARAIAEIHNASNSYNWLNEPTLRLARCLYPRADDIIAVSESVRRDALGFFRLDPGRVHTIYNPISLGDIRRSSKGVCDPILANLGSFVMGCGRLEPMKGFSDLIRAFSRIRDMPGLKLVILGDGSCHNELLDCASSHGVGDRVLLPGFRANPYQFFARARAFVLASRFGEASPLVLAEAMACGTPVISSRCEWGPEEILGNGEYGLLYDVGKVEDLSRHLCQVLSDPEQASARAARALQRARDFSDDVILPELERRFMGPGREASTTALVG